MTTSTAFLAQLANPAARTLALSTIVGIVLSAFRMKSTALRLFAWTTVLYAALAMPLLQQMLPPLPVPAPALLEHELATARTVFSGAPEQAPPLGNLATGAAERRKNAAHGASRGRNADAMKPQRGERSSPVGTQTAVSAGISARSPLNAAPAPSTSIPWTLIAGGIYLSVALILIARFFVGLAFGRRLLQASQKIDESHLTQRLAACASASGLAFVPRAAESDLISVPLTMGALHPTILLPTAWRAWDDLQLDAVVAHEVSHVARRDPLTQRLSLLHRALFWFSPLSWWLDRHLADLAEQASDEAALSSGTDRKHYARILLGFFEALQATPGRVWWQGVSMAKAGQAEQRLERILAWKGSVAMSLKKSIAVVVVAFAIPVVYLAAAAHPAQHVPFPGAQFTQDQIPTPPPATSEAPTPPETAPEPTPALAPALAPATIRGTIKGGVAGIPTPSLAPAGGIADGVVAPVAPVAPIAPVAPFPPPAVWSGSQSEASKGSSGRGFSYHYGFDDEQRFVIVSGKTDALTMSGSTEDARHAEKLKKNIPGDFIWFQRDEKSYVIRDQATVDRARKLWEPEEELGKKQEALGKQQEALGKQQQELGARMEKIRVNVPDMTAEIDKLKAELKQLSSGGATVDQVGHIQSEIGDLQSKIGDLQSHAGDQQGKLGEEMGALGEKQGKLGEEQGKLGEQQGKLAEQATRDMKQLLDEAITKGTAQPEL